jgi:hypothetical protein
MEMKLTDLSSAQAAALIKLLKRKEKLQGQLAEVEADLAALSSGKVVEAKVGKPARKKESAPRAKRGELQQQILGLLKDAGKEGMAVKDMAAKLKSPMQRLNVWLYTSGKKIPGLKKVGRGRFAYQPKE